MADIISDGMTKVGWVTTISNTAAPTAVEVNAGVDLETFLTPDGLGVSTSTDAVDAASLASTQDQEIPGRRKDSITLTFKDQGEAAAPFTTFASRPAGFLVVRRGVASTTDWTAAQKVHVYPVTAGDRQPQPSAKNEVLKLVVPLFVTGPVQASVALA
jgi:type V secretory pathway adhesin AidA